jgi:hypothetical protein
MVTEYVVELTIVVPLIISTIRLKGVEYDAGGPVMLEKVNVFPSTDNVEYTLSCEEDREYRMVSVFPMPEIAKLRLNGSYLYSSIGAPGTIGGVTIIEDRRMSTAEIS